MNYVIEIIQEPSVNNDIGNDSHWNASQNPMIWKFQRKDYNIKSVQALSAGTTRIYFWRDMETINAGDSIWWGDSINLKDGEYDVFNVDHVNWYIDIVHTFNGSVLGWVNDTKNITNYHVYLQIYRWGDITDFIAIAKFYDDKAGVCTADLHKFVEGELTMVFPSFFNIATQEPTKDRDFSFIYGPGFLNPTFGGSPIYLGDYAQRYWVYKASAQLGDEFGQNMRRQMIYGATDPLNTDALMKFNTVFDEPYIFDGYPFAISFIYSDHFVTNYLHRKIQRLDINNDDVDSEATDLVPSTIKEHGCVLTMRDFGALTDETKGFYVWLEDSGVPLTVDPGGGGSGSGGGGSDPSAFEDEVFEPLVFE